MANRFRMQEAAAKRHVQRNFEQRLTAGAKLVLGRARKLVGVSANSKAASAMTVTRDGKKVRLRKGRRVYGSVPSQPGEPPRKRTGKLREQIQMEVQAWAARVGTNQAKPPYPRWLELGTRKMKARPWLRRALNEMISAVRAVLGKDAT